MRRAGAWLSALALTACYDPAPPNDHGLEPVKLWAESSDVARLRSGTFTDTPIALEVEVFGKTQLAELSVAGRSSVDDFKKSFNLELERGGARRRYRLDAMSRDPSAVRGHLTWDIHATAGFETPALQYVSLFLNGEYLGLYLLYETIDEDFFTSRDMRPLSIYAARDTLATMERTADLERAFADRLDGTDYRDLARLVAALQQDDAATIERLLDADSVIDYMAAAAFSDNRDGIVNNFVLYRTARDPRFAILPWDLDWSLRFVNRPEDGSLFAPNAMMRWLWKHPAARHRYLCRLAALDGALEPRQIEARLDGIADRIAEAWAADRLLGGGPLSLAEHLEAIAARSRAQAEALSDLEPAGACPAVTL